MSHDTDSEPQFADLLDELLERTLNGEEIDRRELAARFPLAAARLDEAIALAGGAAGRRGTIRPTVLGYEIVRELGRGGMGTVYLARHASLQRDVALKVLPPSFGLTPAGRQRFLAEARALAQVKHEHIVDIHRIVDEGELLAFEMEFVDGPSLHEVLGALRQHLRATGTAPGMAQLCEAIGVTVAQLGTRNPTQFFVRKVLKVARALAAVHRGGFVHRDVKPANVLLRRDGEPVLVDFGLVRAHGGLTARGAGFAGTPVYSSPEQLRGDDVGPASDVYSLGVTLYECLALATPFAGRDTKELLARIEQGNFPPLRSLAPATPVDLATIVAHAMERDPGARYASGGELADDLQRLLDLQPIAARPAGWLRRFGKLLRRQQRPLLAAAAGAALVAMASWPVVHAAESTRRDRATAERHVLAARSHLLAIESMHTGPALPGGADAVAGPVLGSRQAVLAAALDDYERAVALDHRLRRSLRERSVVRLASWLQQLTVTQVDSLDQAFASREFLDCTDRLGPLTVLAARQLAGQPQGDADPLSRAAVAGGERDDRFTLGLLAFACGDLALCERAWAQLEAELPDQPLVDAGLGRLWLADGMAEAAQVRLQQAQRHFPDSSILANELAEAALAVGNLELARRWLQHLDSASDRSPARRRLELDLRAARDASVDLRDDYAALAAAHPDDLTIAHRLAQLAMRRGELAAAERRLDQLLARWPNAATLRLDRARLALQRRDLPAYAEQVLFVLDQAFGRAGSQGTAMLLLEILRLGGLDGLHRDGIAATGGTRIGRSMFGGEMPVRGFASPAPSRDFEAMLRYWHVVRRVATAIAGPEQGFDAGSRALFVLAPTAAALLPTDVAPFGPRLRAAMAVVPWVARQSYPKLREWLVMLIARARLWGWSRVETDGVPLSALPVAQCRGRSSLLRIDDATGDGREDVLLAVPSVRPGHATGVLMVVDGGTAAVVARFDGDAPRHQFGNALAQVGDFDGDGHRDWLIGAPSADPEERHGRAEIWSSRKRRLLLRLEGDQPGFGVSLTGLGDVDGDGWPEFAVATPPILRNAAAQGSVSIFDGRRGGVVRVLQCDAAGVWFGASVADAGDVDGDGRHDLLVGGNFGNAPGLVRLHAGGTWQLLQSWSEASPTSGFGAAMAGVPDVDGDGHRDVAIGAVSRTGRNGIDRVVLFSGQRGSQIGSLSDQVPGSGFGSTIVPCSRGDSTLLAIGVPDRRRGAGGAFEFWWPAGSSWSSLTMPVAANEFGDALTTMPDSDGDGWPELFVLGLGGSDGRLFRIESSGAYARGPR